MPDLFTRPVEQIDDQLAEARAEEWRAEKTLADIRLKRDDLDGQELAAVSVITGCHRRYDYLLDERLRAGETVDAGS